MNGWREPQTSSTAAFVKPLSGPTPGDLIVIDTVTQVANAQLYVRVASISNEDVFYEIKSVVDSNNIVDFKRVSVDEEMVFVRETTTDRPDGKPAVRPIDLSNIDCTPQQRIKLESLFQKHASVFTKDENDLGHTETVKHRIPVLIKYQLRSVTWHNSCNRKSRTLIIISLLIVSRQTLRRPELYRNGNHRRLSKN